MGCSISFFKKLCQRIWRRNKNDRWVRDDERRLLPPHQKRPHYGPIPKRIEQKVIEDIVKQDLPRRVAAQPECNMYDEIHRKLIAPLYPPHHAALHSSSVEAGGCPNKNESAKRQVSSCPEPSVSPPPIGRTSTRKGRRKRKTTPTGSCEDDNLAFEQMLSDYRREMDLVPAATATADLPVVASSSSSSYQLLRYGVVVYSCKSTDASWMKLCGS